MTTTSSGRRENRLANEKSPYLLQHADNPVDWYPWDKEAFEKARRENKPIFLSVGYSTCHWCHVMAHESFENEEIAKIMNENFVNIKVDREVRPDVDRMYMAFVTATFGEGGWPMSVFLTPDLYPIFGGTYFPPKDRYGRLGFPSLLKRIAQLWKEQPDKMKESGKNVIEQLRSVSSSDAHDLSQDALSVKTAHKCYTYFANNFDDVEGGFGGEPKFPTPVRLHFLLRHYYYNISESGHPDGSFDSLSVAEIREKGVRLGIDFKGCSEKNEYLEMLKTTVENQFQEAQSNLNIVALTLTKIARGGIHDHVSNGFHRYSTDHYWHVPHFEKMLYDQAQLLASFIETYLITKNEYYAENARDIIKYIERDLQDPASGAFFSAEDADSYPYDGAPHKLEGAFAVWEKSELDRILGDEDSRIFCYHFGVENNGNVPRGKDIQGELVNKNVLIKRHTLRETADEFNLSQKAVNETLASCKNRLAKFRAEERPKPHRDDKILTAWNGLTISGLTRAYNALGEKKFLELAEGAAKFLKDRMYDADRKVILRSFREEAGNVEGFSDDYSFLIQGLLDLYESTFNESYLAWAVDLQETQNELFYDEEGGGGYFNVSDDNKSILVRMKDDHDGAEPSPNSVTISNLLRLYTFVQNPDYNAKAEATLKSYVGTLQNRPHSMPSLVASMMLFLKGVKQIVIVGRPENPTTREFISTIRGQFLPNCVLMFTPVEKDVDSSLLAQKNDVIKSILQSSASETEQEPTPAVYICENFTCGMPIKDVETLVSTLKTNIFFEWDPE